MPRSAARLHCTAAHDTVPPCVSQVDLLATKDSWSTTKRNAAAPPLGWDPTLVDQIITATAADIMKRPCVVSPKPEASLHYVAEDASSVECARIFWEKRIGALLVKETRYADSKLVGIMSERDFIKALATESVGSSKVRDLMTPVAKMITVSLSTGVGECMELMRKHNIRHLPVMATETGEDKQQAIQNLKSSAERAEANARKQFNAYELKLRDAFGEAEGGVLFASVNADPDGHSADDRPLVQRAATAAAKLHLAEGRLAAVAEQGASLASSHPVGIISIRDLLLAMTANQVVPLLDWLNEERRTLIEERVGYSE